MSSTDLDPRLRPFRAGRRPLLNRMRLCRALSWWLAGAALLAAGGSLAFSGELRGRAVLDGNLRGTALVVLVLGLPLLIAGMLGTARGSARGLVAWLAAVAYLTYQGVMFSVGTPHNRLFTAYVALLGLALWTLIALLVQLDPAAVAGRVDDRAPFQAVGAALLVFATLNGLGWLAQILPAALSGDRPAALVGSGLPTSPVWVQDLAFWIPAALVVGSLAWRRRPRGLLLTTAFLGFYVVECVSVASDQWFGVRADDSYPAIASLVAVPGALVAAALLSVPLVWSLRHLDAGPVTGPPRSPDTSRR